MKRNELPPMSEIQIIVMGPDQSLLRAQPKSTLTEDQKKEQFKLIHSYLYHGGSKTDDMTELQYVTAFEMGDGYGPMDAATLFSLELMADWSHIRDSSDEALERIYNYLKLEGF